MCGIAGGLGRSATEEVVRDMLRAQVHRGPDGAGVEGLVDAGGHRGGVLAACRLAILDLSEAGRQPMRPQTSSLIALSYNGEVYNHAHLRRELERDGARFRGGSDTEVVLQGLERHGSPFLSRMRGMFALAFWDGRIGTLTLARDQIGIKPLYVAIRGTSLLFASEIRALLASGQVSRRLCPAGLRTYLNDGAVREPFTAIEGIWELPAGSVLHAEASGAAGLKVQEPRPYGESAFRPHRNRSGDVRDAAGRIRQVLLNAVQGHLDADVPVAVLLSGGLDSSGIAALASQASRNGLSSLSVGFPTSPLDELARARTVAARLGTTHHELVLNEEDSLGLVSAAFQAMDQPTYDGINTYVACEAARQAGFKVVLSGLGADELFAGYPSFRRAWWLGKVWSSAPLRRAIVSAFPGERPWAVRLRHAARERDPARAAYVASRTFFNEYSIRRLSQGPGACIPDRSRPPDHLSPLQRVCWYETTGYMRNVLLRDSDVFSMANGVELRVPYLDRDVLRAVLAVDERLHLGRNGSKQLLRESLAPLLPRDTRLRRKQGFELPFADWLRGPLAEQVGAMLDSPAVERVGLTRPAVREVWRRFRRSTGRAGWTRSWGLFALTRWAELNDVTAVTDQTTTMPGQGWFLS